MKALKYAFDLDCKLAIYVPSTVNVSEQVDNEAMRLHVMRELSSLFGGATSTKACGAWIDSAGNTIIENVDIVYSFCTSEQATQHFEKVIHLCEYIKKEMNQEAVTLEYNGQVKFI